MSDRDLTPEDKADERGSAEPVESLRRALTIIANWTLPPTGKFWDEEKTRPTSYEAEYGSNGARAYMQATACAALAAHPDSAQARDAVLEDAAKACEGRESMDADACAAAIRAKKGKPA